MLNKHKTESAWSEKGILFIIYKNWLRNRRTQKMMSSTNKNQKLNLKKRVSNYYDSERLNTSKEHENKL